MSAKILNFPKINDPRGSLTFIQNPTHIPFEIKHIFWSHHPTQVVGSANEQQEEIIVALKGSFDVIVTHPNGAAEKFTLDSPQYGLYLPALTWRHIENFLPGALGFHLTSLKNSEGYHISNFETYKNKIAQ